MNRPIMYIQKYNTVELMTVCFQYIKHITQQVNQALWENTVHLNNITIDIAIPNRSIQKELSYS